MKKSFISSKEMHALEINSEYFGVSRLQLMENAGRNVATEVSFRFKPEEATVTVFCGLGGNGGDGFVVARHLASMGFKVSVMLAGNASNIADEAARKNWIALQPLKKCVETHEISDSTLVSSVEANVIVDALLGTGLKGPVRQPILHLVKRINEAKGFCVAVDVPTGVNSDSGDVPSEAVKANLTVTFHKMKLGLQEAEEYVGEVVVKDIGIPYEMERFVGPGDVSLARRFRPTESHKGDFGRVLVIGGNEVFSGAPALAALAALRAGVDLAYVAAPEKTSRVVSAMSPNLITLKLDGEHLNPRNIPVIKRYLGMITAVIMGPGLGLHKETISAVEEIVKIIEDAKIPLLLDADGLKAFAEFKQQLKSPLVLTPHAGEYKKLVGKEPSKDLEERVRAVQKTANDLGAVVLLKGPVDLISDGKRVKLNFTGNPGMTVGGTGDVLSGIVGAFLAQKVDPFEAAVTAAFINGACGDFVQNEKGYHMVPTDLLDWIPKVMEDPMAHRSVRTLAP
jgi:NAD(P)H-hydrate epimerase